MMQNGMPSAKKRKASKSDNQPGSSGDAQHGTANAVPAPMPSVQSSTALLTSAAIG
jgi:hypothetical protein